MVVSGTSSGEVVVTPDVDATSTGGIKNGPTGVEVAAPADFGSGD